MSSYFGREGGCRTGQADYECFRDNAAKKMTPEEPGWWYSPQDLGYCGLHTTPAANCTWRVVSVEKIVTKDCHNDRYFSGVEKTSPTCFRSCPHGAGTGRNISDPCWIRCFYEAVLGPESGKPGGQVTGIPLDTLVGFWTSAFDDESKGGCPSIKEEKRGWFQ